MTAGAAELHSMPLFADVIYVPAMLWSWAGASRSSIVLQEFEHPGHWERAEERPDHGATTIG